MNTTGNTILITGGGSGIGRGLAEAFHKLGNQVIISGRRQQVLDETVAANPGLKSLTVDMSKADSIRDLAAKVAADFPALNVVINNAGIAKFESILKPGADGKETEAMVDTNILGPIRLTTALLPQLQRQAHAAVLMVSSGLAFVPLALGATYCATKAFVHSYSQSLRYQLKDTPVDVLEIIPPYVQTELGGEQQKTDPRAMPLDAFISEVMDILKNQPDETEICVQNVLAMRFAAADDRAKYDKFFRDFNGAMTFGEH